MSLKTYVTTLDQKIKVLDLLIADARRDAKFLRTGEAVERFRTLRAIAADLEVRRGYPRSNALGELDCLLRRILASQTALGYDAGRLEDLARHVINKWPFISQAMERFGEEGAE